MFRGVRIVLRGLSDTFENLLQYFVFTISWWLCVATIVLAPGAMLALFLVTDPRHGSSGDRPSAREFYSAVFRLLGRGWKLGLMTWPPLALLIYNLVYYGDRQGGLALLAPAWLALSVVAGLIAVSALSVAALMEMGAVAALRTAAILTGAKLGHALVVAILLVVLVAFGAILIVPAVMFLPATVAATFNRLVLNGLQIPVFDPLAPTEERLIEEAAGKSKRRWGP